MYHAENILIIKTSSLGDIIQAFSILPYLRRKLPTASIHWAVEERFASVVAAHPLIEKAIPFQRSLFSIWKAIRQDRYDQVFDLQGNCKSGFLTLLSRSSQKVGFGKKSVREWPNLLSTHIRYEVPASLNIRHQYLDLIQQHLGDTSKSREEGVRFKIGEEEREHLCSLLSASELNRSKKVMVCPGSRWINKRLPIETLISFLMRVSEKFDCSYLLMWGSEEEKKMCEQIQSVFQKRSLIIAPLAVPVWQNLMSDVDLLIAVDSSALHLCGTTSTSTFSIFGPTHPDVFKPLGSSHCAIQGSCPYGRKFEKQCPILRSCPTGACIRHLTAEEIFSYFERTAWSRASKSI